MADAEGKAVRLGNLVVDPARADAWIDGRPTRLTYVELELLIRLSARAGRLVRREDLSSILTHDPSAERSVPLNVHISRLRKKLRGSRPWSIKTVWKRGYMLREEPPPGGADHSSPGAITTKGEAPSR
jgi:DNA-binding response OmpR family regulator